MKVWCFYLLDNKQTEKYLYPNVETTDIHLRYQTLYSLYAFTPTKACAEYFWKTRNRKIFYRKAIEMSRDEYEDFCDAHEKHLLEFHIFVTKVYDEDNDTLQEETVNILCPMSESDSILYYAETHMDNILGRGMSMLSMFTNPKAILKEKMYTLLERYFQITEVLNVLYPFEENTITESYYPYAIDEVMLYCHLYGHTFAKHINIPVIQELQPLAIGRKKVYQ